MAKFVQIGQADVITHGVVARYIDFGVGASGGGFRVGRGVCEDWCESIMYFMLYFRIDTEFWCPFEHVHSLVSFGFFIMFTKDTYNGT
jgi:alpha/beta superfamily hydrolase